VATYGFLKNPKEYVMDASFHSGNIGPFRGGFRTINIGTADIPMLLGGAHSLIKGVAIVGGLAMGALMVGGVILGGIAAALREEEEDKARFPLGTVPVIVSAGTGHYWGIILNSHIDIRIDGSNLKIGMEQIKSLKRSWGTVDIKLIDGSKYTGIKSIDVLSISSIGGMHKLRVATDDKNAVRLSKIVGGNAYQVKQLREALDWSCRQNEEAVCDIMKDAKFVKEHFYNVSAPAGA
jgi:hypothetical protein